MNSGGRIEITSVAKKVKMYIIPGVEVKPEDLFCMDCKEPISIDVLEGYDGRCPECYKKWHDDWKKAVMK